MYRSLGAVNEFGDEGEVRVTATIEIYSIDSSKFPKGYGFSLPNYSDDHMKISEDKRYFSVTTENHANVILDLSSNNSISASAWRPSGFWGNISPESSLYQ